jgi:hypothetical protein
MKHLKTFENFHNDINEGLFSDMKDSLFNKIKGLLSKIGLDLDEIKESILLYYGIDESELTNDKIVSYFKEVLNQKIYSPIKNHLLGTLKTTGYIILGALLANITYAIMDNITHNDTKSRTELLEEYTKLSEEINDQVENSETIEDKEYALYRVDSLVREMDKTIKELED